MYEEWEELTHYMQHHPRWFESVNAYTPTGQYTALLEEYLPDGWNTERQGIWHSVYKTDGKNRLAQGWKLHVSITLNNAIESMKRTLPVLKDEGVPFKIVLDPRTHGSVNDKTWPRESSGKFMTVYPQSDEQFERLANTLTEALREFVGPHILSDRPWKNSKCLYYRYGAFVSMPVLNIDGTSTLTIRAPDGSVAADQRNPYWSPPEWIDDTHRPPSQEGTKSDLLLNRRYKVTTALRFTSRGGVYAGIDTRTNNTVVIKESRPHIHSGRQQVDGITLLKKEYEVLRELETVEQFVSPFDFFMQDGHAFMVEPLVKGEHLGRYTIMNNPLYHGHITQERVKDYLSRMKPIWRDLALAIESAHERGIHLGDLSFTNVLISDQDAGVQIIDLETASRHGRDINPGVHTPGFTWRDTTSTDFDGKANDYFALGSLVFGSLMVATNFFALCPDARQKYMSELQKDLAFPLEIMELVEDLWQRPDSVPSQEQLSVRLERLDLDREESSTRARPKLSVPTTIRYSPESLAPLESEVSRARDEGVKYLLQAGDPRRTDRLHPSDYRLFSTNPVSVAFGAAGVLHAIHTLCGEVPGDFRKWFAKQRFGNEHLPPGLYMGQAGVAWVLSEIGLPELAIDVMRSARKHHLLFDSHSIGHGVAGYGLACLKLWKRGLGDDFLDEASRAYEHLRRTSIAGRDGSYWKGAGGEHALGYIDGGSGVSLFLLYYALATGSDDARRLSEEALSFELSRALWLDGSLAGFPSEVIDEEEEGPVVARCYWDAGSAGVLTALARHVAVDAPSDFHDWLAPLVGDVDHKYAVFPQMFHGISGLGNAALDAWQLCDTVDAISVGWKAAEGVLLYAIDEPDGTTFPGEQCLRQSSDLATGGSGIILFLDRLLRASRGEDAGNFNFVVDEIIPVK